MPRGLPGSVMAYFDVDCPAGSAELRHADWLVYELLRAFVGQRGRNDAPLELGHLPQDGGHRAEHRHQDGATDEASHGRRCLPCDRTSNPAQELAAGRLPSWWGVTGAVSASRLHLCPPSSRAARPARGCSFRLCLLREPRVARMDASVRMWLLELLSLAAPRSAGTSSPRPLVFATRPAGSALAFAPAPFRTCCRFPSSSDGRFRTRTPTPRGVARTHERLSSRGSVLCLCPPARTLVVCVLCVGWFLSASP